MTEPMVIEYRNGRIKYGSWEYDLHRAYIREFIWDEANREILTMDPFNMLHIIVDRAYRSAHKIMLNDTSNPGLDITPLRNALPLAEWLKEAEEVVAHGTQDEKIGYLLRR